MKQILLFIFGLIPTIASATVNDYDIWDGVSCDQSWYFKSSTEYHISTAAELKGLADLVNISNIDFEGKTIILTSDIDLKGYQWTPIGYGVYTHYFKGNFNGKNHKIKNLKIDTDKLPNSSLGFITIGLFGNSDEANISNLRVDNATINVNKGWMVAQVSVVAWKCNKISNVKANSNINIQGVSSTITLSQTWISGLVGHCNVMTDCESHGNITGNAKVKYESLSVSGMVINADTIKRCMSDVSMSIDLTAKPNNPNAEYAYGIVSNSKIIKDVIFSGSISFSNFVWGQSGNGVALIYGIADYADSLTNALSLPSSLDGTLTHNVHIIGGSNNTIYSDCFYRNDLGYSQDKATGMANSYFLTGVTPSSSFSDDVWLFEAGSYPRLRSLIAKYNVNIINDYGSVGYEVEEEGNCTVVVNSDDGWQVVGVYVNGDDMIEELDGNKLKLSNITENKDIRVVYTTASSGISAEKEFVENGTLKMDGKDIVLSGFRNGDKISVYTIDGKFIKKQTISDRMYRLNLADGIYIIKAGRQTFKVSI